ncbi:MAG: 50S ribosome-binding GTPase, partial [Planctomycetes bacterium]|nr:50S ribosome-binding GTPase [Planctomycetota bacterium]
VAVASPPGWAARGIVRLSGPEALATADAVFVSDDGQSLPDCRGFTRLFGRVRLDRDRTFPAECYVFRAPHSYTRQDGVELHVPGSPPLLAMLTEALVTGGARLAQPGEFTARAFLAGALDLTRVEAVAALIRARSDGELRAARGMMRGYLTDSIRTATDALADLTARVEADIDFAEEPINFIAPAELTERLGELVRDLTALIDRADSTERLAVLPSILLFGAPNVGKSSLMNALSGMDRAICSAVAGTTRDVLSAPLALGRAEALLWDAAGHQADTDELADRTRQATQAAAQEADLICLVVDLTEHPTEAEWAPLRAIGRTAGVVAANKSDLLDEAVIAERVAALEAADLGAVCPVSAATGAGLDALRQAFAARLFDDPSSSEDRSVALTARQHEHLEAARSALERAAGLASEMIETIDSADLIALELREALAALGAVTGEVTTDDLLGRVFASFCIGK